MKIPIKIIKKKITVVKNHLKILAFTITVAIGMISAISTSKMIKMIAIKKNRIENGIREKLNILNPHSKQVVFSRSFSLFFEIINVIKRKISDKTNLDITIIEIKII